MPEDLMISLRAGRLGRTAFLWTAVALTAATVAATWWAGVSDGLGLAAIGFWAGLALGAAVWLRFAAWLAVTPTRRGCA